jgi:CubicO group peptidase (beta-lactamase class C family)
VWTFGLRLPVPNTCKIGHPAVMALARNNLRSLLSEACVPGASMAVVQRGSVVVDVAGVTSTESGAEVRADTIFDAASLSKPVFAYAVLQLVDGGHLSLETKLSDWASEYVRDDPRARMVTVGHALSHRTGLPNWRSAEFPLRTYWAPGERFGYSGEGFTWLQRTVEAITGQPLETLMHRLVFDPLGMKKSSYIWQPTFEVNYAAPHDVAQKAGTKRKPEDAMAAFSLHTTAADYSRFLQATLAGRNLHASTAALWLSPQVALWQRGILALTPDTPEIDTRVAWGLGWGLEPDLGTFFQWGDNDQGRHKTFAIGSVHEQVAVVILTNGFNGMSIVPELVEGVLPGRHPCFDWLGYQRHSSLA